MTEQPTEAPVAEPAQDEEPVRQEPTPLNMGLIRARCAVLTGQRWY